MNNRIKLLSAWKSLNGVEHPAGTILEVDEHTYKNLTSQDEFGAVVAKSFSEAEEAAEKSAIDAENARIETIAKQAALEVVKNMGDDKNEGQSFVNITVGKDGIDEDPWGGYMPGYKLNGRYSDAEKQFALGAFALDVHDAEVDGVKSNRLTSHLDRSEKAIKNASEFLDPAQKSTIAVTGNQGVGFMMPPAMSALLLEQAEIESVVRPRATKVALDGASLDLPFVQDDDRSADVLYGGIQAYWTAEESAMTATSFKMDNVSLKLNKLTCLGYITDEVRRFSPVTAGGWLLPRFADAIAWKEDTAFLEGKGAGQPLGIFATQNKSLVTVAKESGQNADTLDEANITNMYSRLHQRRAGSVAWVMNRQCFPTLYALNDGNNNRLFTNSGPGGQDGIANAPNGSLLGYPVVYNEKRPVIGDAGDIALADFSGYIIADDRQGPEIAQSIHLKFDQGKTAYRVVKFVDGRPAMRTTKTPRKGNAISNALILAERA